MKLVITGGHLNPALAVIDELPKDTEILMIGRKYAIEGDKALSLEYLASKSLNIPFKSIRTGRLQRKFTKHTIISPLKLPYGFFQSLLILKKFKPDAILCFGGYISLPVAFAGRILKIPVVIHEQTLEAGAANKLISKFAKKVCISWESSAKFFPPNKTILTGNPIRKFSCEGELSLVKQISRPKADQPLAENENLPLIYITGGSLGSHAINTLIEGCIEKLLQKYRVIHQTGDAKEFLDFDRLSNLKEKLNPNLQKRYFLIKFIEPFEVGGILKQADLVVSRSGINTITELIYFGKPSILIPLPYSQNHEQIKNAEFLKDLGLGIYLNQYELTPDKLYEWIIEFSQNLNQYSKNKEVKKVILSDSAKKIIEILKSVFASK
ncbi:MAG: UDP-N-acetylglucosamine--N-acetylmuramyl-(pentapeptide) pyrophosphoryl-undecaprenol N-acetylglucosamine transferase [Candidatus Levybacteria bacterium]|nr:UDP-N-acetylglucosamine--N-acetylmuramyl-(pentapeptide) pyrophosphoryl-undecaprenol N-acetylglucosamine transferase [Candidatus Levybacteria bacterium]